MNANNLITQLDQNFPIISEAGFIHDQEFRSFIHRSELDIDEFESLVMRIYFITMDPDKKIKYFINQYENGQFLYLVEISDGLWMYILSSNEAFAKMHFFVKYATSDDALDMSVAPSFDAAGSSDGEEAAKRIQGLLFSNPTTHLKHFQSAELWYQPQGVIGGDFYWGKKTKNAVWMVIGDCTGHGVEGALATVSVLSILEQVFDEDLMPHMIIKKVHQSLENIQKQKLEDGYGIGNEMMVIKYDLANNTLHYSATGILLYHLHNNKIVVYKTKKAIYEPDRVIKYLRSRKLDIAVGDELLVHSDGLIDQMNADQKRLKQKNLLAALNDASSLSLNVVKNAVNQWKKEAEQTDDMVALSFKR